MKTEKTILRDHKATRSKSIMIADRLLKIVAFFMILEPIWMLLPFAGFLYGSVMHIEKLSEHPSTSWLVHFVFPTHTLFPLGIILAFIGFTIFCVGAFQIYRAKWFKKGMVATGIYRKFRHPQYLALALFGIGILLTWGRFITYIAFFVMMWLYYFLSKSEEKQCLQLFGDEYEAYCHGSYFIFPGEGRVFSMIRKLHTPKVPQWVLVPASFLTVLSLSIGSGFLIQATRAAYQNTIPAIEGSLQLSDGGNQKVKLLMIKGPALQAAPLEKRRTLFMAKVFEMLLSSDKIKQALKHYDFEEHHTLLTFITPGSNWYGGDHENEQTATVNAFIFITQTPMPYHNNFSEFRKNWQILKQIKVPGMCYGRLASGQDPVSGKVVVSGPPTPEVGQGTFQKKVQERISFFLSGV